MKLSTKCRYGTRAMIEIARHYPEGPVKRKEISRSQKISPAYLENILIALKTHNLIRTVRGASGGFTLDTSPDNITMFQIVQALEGSIAPVDCVESSGACERSGYCASRKLWQDLYSSQVEILKKTTLQSLVDMDDSLKPADYSI
jgi:Rrf2 family transcriptional regulator, cysteine metabolism repressor